VYVRGLLTYPGGGYLWWTGRCYSRDYGPDWFSLSLLQSSGQIIARERMRRTTMVARAPREGEAA
jgi:hypothetical protein